MLRPRVSFNRQGSFPMLSPRFSGLAQRMIAESGEQIALGGRDGARLAPPSGMAPRLLTKPSRSSNANPDRRFLNIISSLACRRAKIKLGSAHLCPSHITSNPYHLSYASLPTNQKQKNITQNYSPLRPHRNGRKSYTRLRPKQR